MCERGEPVTEGELRNNNRLGGAPADGDPNANDIRAEEGGGMNGTVSLSPLTTGTAEKDKVIIWGTDSQCDDPELAEFEMLECQELEAYLGEDGEDFVGLADRKEPDDGGREESRSESREASRTEADVVVSCPSSNMAATTDGVGRTQTTDSRHIPSTISEDPTLASRNAVSERGEADRPRLSSATSTTRQNDVDVNLNSTADSRDVASQVSGEHRKNQAVSQGDCDGTKHKTKKPQGESSSKMDKSTQADEAGDANRSPPARPRAARKQGSFDGALKKQNSFDKSLKKPPSSESSLKKQLSFDNTLKKQGSAESAGSLSLERRKPWGSPGRPASPASSGTPSCSPKRRPPGSPAKVQGVRALSLERCRSPQRGLTQTVRPPGKTPPSSGIPKPVAAQQKEPEPGRSSSPQKPKNIRPKIITYVRANPQAKVTDAPHEASAPPRLSPYSSPLAHRDPKSGPQPKSTPVLCSSNLLFDKYRQEMQKAGCCAPGPAGTGGKPPSGAAPQRPSGKSGSFHEEAPEKRLKEASQEGAYRSPRALRPQLGLGAVARQPAAKTRGQRAAGAPPQGHQDSAGEPKRSGPEAAAPKSLPIKPGQSGLRPPGFSGLPAARLAAFGFVRSAGVSSGLQSCDGGRSDACRPPQQPHDDDPAPGDAPQAQSRPQPPNAPSLQRRTLPPQRCSPLASRREAMKDKQAPPKSPPKRFAVVSPKPQSPVRGRTAAVHGSVRTDRAQDLDRTQELDRALLQALRERCERQALQLQSLQAQFRKASLCLDVFSVTTQHFCRQSESAAVKERELSLELARLRDEVAFSVAHWEQLQQEKEAQERRFEAELRGLRARQRGELGALEERLKARHADDTRSLRARLRAEAEELRLRQREQMEEMSENHEASLTEMETAHNDTLATLQEEHARTVKNLKMAHEQQRKSLEEEFEKIRLSLQDQVDTLTFQNRSLRDRAKRFEEALRRSTDEQIVDALAPYKHIEEDLKSLKEVLEMKNQQIHQQELKISELEKIAEKNVYLEERVQVLQQQNEDLKERIDKNLAVSRQLSEENANLQVNVEKESNEKKRLSRTNEELLWRLQTGELSPRMSPGSSPVHRPSPGPGSPARPHSYHQ